jgi:hypothetical protein
VSRLFGWLRLSRREESWKTAEILLLRHQLTVLQRQVDARPKTTWADRALIAFLLEAIPKPRRGGLRLIVTPQTVLGWHRDILRRRGAAKSRPKQPGRPATHRNITATVLRLAKKKVLCNETNPNGLGYGSWPVGAPGRPSENTVVGCSGHYWWLIVSGAGGVLGIVSGVEHKQLLLPLGAWALLFVVCLFFAQFLVFHDVRKARDAALGETAQRFDSLRYRFEMVRLEGRAGTGQRQREPPRLVYTFTFTFRNGGAEVMEYAVEHISVTLLGGYTADPQDTLGSTRAIVLPGQTVDFRYHWIAAPPTPPLPGLGEYSIIYGHPGSLRQFRTVHRFSIGWDNRAGVPASYWTTLGTISHDPVGPPTAHVRGPRHRSSAHRVARP